MLCRVHAWLACHACVHVLTTAAAGPSALLIGAACGPHPHRPFAREQMGGTVYDLEEAELCYAPQYGSAKDVVNFAGG